MMKKSQKYLEKREGDCPSIGNFVHWHILELKLKKKSISDELNIIPTTLNHYFKRESLQFGIVWRLSKAMKFNLLIAIGEHLNIPYETRAEATLRTELAAKDEQIKALEIELGIYRKIVER